MCKCLLCRILFTLRLGGRGVCVLSTAVYLSVFAHLGGYAPHYRPYAPCNSQCAGAGLVFIPGCLIAGTSVLGMCHDLSWRHSMTLKCYGDLTFGYTFYVTEATCL